MPFLHKQTLTHWCRSLMPFHENVWVPPDQETKCSHKVIQGGFSWRWAATWRKLTSWLPGAARTWSWTLWKLQLRRSLSDPEGQSSPSPSTIKRARQRIYSCRCWRNSMVELYIMESINILISGCFVTLCARNSDSVKRLWHWIQFKDALPRSVGGFWT